MNTFLIALIIIVALLLVLLIMVQNPKGGGLSSTFGGGGATMGGVQSTNSFLDKSTWVLVASITVLIIMTNIILKPKKENVKSGLKGTIENREVRDTPADTETAPATPVAPEGETDKSE